MSGGYFDYKQYELDNIADNIEQVIRDWESKKKSEWDDNLKWDFKNPFTILELYFGLKIMRTASVYAQRIDYLLSGDDGEDNFYIRLHEDLRKIRDRFGDSE